MTDTHCKDCKFYDCIPASDIYENTNYGLLNLCELQKIDQYKEKGITVQEDFGDIVLNNFVCPFKRDNTWERSDQYKTIEEQIISENGFPYSVFMYEKTGIDIEKAVEQILLLDHAPVYLHVTFEYMHQDESLLSKLVEMIEGHKTTIKYKLVINLEEPLDHFYESYLAFRLNIKTPFVAIYDNNYDLDPSLTTNISNKIHKELLSFPYKTTENYEFTIYPIGILEEYINMEGSKFIDRIRETYLLCQQYQL